MSKIFKKLVLSAAATAGAIIWLSTCDIGLGSSVDTQAPSLTIENPVSSVVYRDEIPVNGTWSDDKGVTRIDISLTNISTDTKLPDIYTAEITDAKSWNFKLHSGRSVNVSEDGVVLPDGKYEVNVTAYDASGHTSGTRSRSFTVDSTPPVFVITKPNSTNINDPAVYGRTVQITGKISEDNSVKSMKVRIFRVNADGTAGEEVNLIKNEFTDFDPLDTMVTVAKYFEKTEGIEYSEEELELYENYKKLYGVKGDDVFDTTQKYYTVITLKDNAGNESDKTYIGSLLDKALTEAIGKKLESSDIKNILNGSTDGGIKGRNKEEKLKLAKIILAGTVSDDEDEATKSRAEAIFSKYNYLATESKKLAFSVDSRANPTYSMSSEFKAKPVLDSLSEVLPDGVLTINVNSGLDNDAITPSGITITIYEIDGETGKTINGKDENGNDSFITITGENIYNSNDQKISESQTATNAATYRVKLEDFKERFKRGAYYCLKLSGKDDNENEFIPKDEVPAGMKDTIVYAFQIQRDNVIPTVKFYGHTDGDYVKATDFASSENGKLTFRVAAKSGAEMTVTSCVSVFEGIKTEFDEKNDFTGEVQSQILPAQKVNAGSAQTVEVPVKINNLEEKNYTLAIKVCVQITNGNSATEVFYVHADNKAPEFEVTNTELKKTRIIITEQDENSVSKTESENGFEYYYTVNGKWSDIEGSGTGSIEYRFRGSGQNDFGSWIRLSEDEAVQTQRTMRWEKTFKIEGGEGKNIALDYRACDQAGNETGIKSFENIIFDFAAPEVKLSEGTLPLEKYYGKNSSPVLSLTASDSNELKSVIVEVKKDGVLLEGDGLEANGVTVTNAALAEGEKSHGVSVNLTNDGVYQVKVTTSDIAERISEYTAQTTIDGTAPVIKGTITLDDESLNENKYYGGKRWLVKGSYTESVLLDKIFYYLKKPADSTDVTSFADLSKVDNVQQIVPDDENISAGEYGFEVNLAFDDNKDGKANILYIQARDKAGNLSQISSYTVNIDTAPPALALKTEDLSSAYKKDSSASVTLTAKDENALSKINVSISKKNDAGAYVALTDNELAEIVTRDPINPGTTKTADVTVTFSTDGTKDGEYRIEISAEDPAGVTSNSYTREVLIDGTLPFLIEPLKLEDAPYSSSYYDSTRLSVSGNYNEKNLKSVYYYIKKIGDTTVINEDSELTSYSKISIAEGTSFEKTLEFENNRNGAGDTLYIQAEDKAGNLSPVTSYAVNVDNEAPSLSGSILNSSYAYSTQNPVLTLTASDTNALSDVSVTVFKKINGSYVELAESELIPNGITVDKGTEPISGKTTTAVTVSFTADGTKDGEYKVLAAALDARGNTSPKAERETIIDGTSPVINGSVLKIGTALYNEQSFYGDTKLNVTGEYTDTALSSVWCYVRKTGETADANAASELSKVTGAKEVTVFETTETGIQFTVPALDFADNKNDGANTLYIQARDKAGNLSSVSTYTVNIDTLIPTVNVNGTALASSYKENESVALALTASDDNALNAVTVIVEKKNSSGGYDDTSDAVTVTQDSITAGTKSVNVNIAFKDTGVADGEYRISALASDVAGHSSTYTASTLIDRTKPVVNDNTLKINNTAYSASSYFGSKTLTVKGDCTEAAALASVYCYVKKPGEETTVTSPLSALTGVKTVTPEGVSFTESTLSFIDNTASAANILYVQAEDKAGNLSEIKSYVINVDTVSPSVIVKENTQALSSSYSRTNEAVTLTLTSKDTESPLSSVSVKVLKKGTDGTYSEIAQSDLESNGVSISNESISSGARTHEVSVSFTGNGTNVNYDGDYKVQVTAADTVGHAFDYEAATVIDGTLPSLVNGIKIEGEVPSSSKYFDRTNLAVTGEYSEPLSTLYYYVKKAGDTASINSSTVLSGLTDVKTVTSFENSVKFEKSIAFEKNVSGSGCMLYLQAKDKAGNLSAITSYIVNVDDQTPVLTGSGLSSSYAYSTQNPVLTLTASDTNALSDVTVVVSKKADGGSYAAIAEADLASNGITVNKGTEPILGKTVAAVTVSFTADGTKDGEYKVLATASDAAGNTSSAVEKETVIDGTKPVISSVKLDDSALSETNYYGSQRPSLSGTYTEAMALDKVYCYVKKPGDTVSVTSPLSEVTGVRTITPSDNSFEDDSLVFGDNTESGANTVYLQAKDKAGNLSELASYTVNVDTVAPALTGALLGTYHKKGSAAGVTLTASDANALKNVRAEVFAADADGNYGEALDTAALEAKGVTVTNENFAPGTKRSHQVSVVFNTDGNHDGKFKVRVSAEDVADRTSTVYESETVIDGTLPVNTGNLLVNGDVYNGTTYSENSKISVSGAYTDSSLIKTVYYLVKKTGETKLTCNENTVLSEISGYKTAVIEGDSFETPNIEFANNTKNDWNVIYIQAEDRAGNLSAVSEYKINVDNVAPHLVVVGNGLADYYKYGQAPSLTLHASDTNKLQTIHLRFFKKNGAGYVELAPEQYAGMGVSVERTTVTDTTNLTISINSITGTNDGEYKLEAWAEDVAGKTSDVYTASTVIDGTIPSEVAGSLEVEGTPYAADKFSSLTKLSVTGKYADANLEAVYGYVKKTGDSDDMSSVTNLSTATLSGTLKTVTTFTQEADGLKFELPSLEFKNNTAAQANTLYIQAKDKAGNFSEIKTYIINIDATPAKLLFKAYKTEEGTLTEASGTAYVNGTNSITVYGEYNDEVSGVEGLTLLKDGEAYSGDAEIKYSTTAITDTASAGTINNWKVYSAGDSKDIKSFKVTFTPTEGGSLTMNGRNGADVSGDSSGSLVLIVDSEAPSITSGLYYANADTGARGSVLFSKEDKYYTNPAGKYYTVAGNLSDNYSLDRAEFIINEGSTEEIKKTAKYDKATGSLLIEKFQLTGLAKVDSAVLTVYDKAGNSSTENFTVVFDTTGPSGYHEIDAKSKDLYFRIGGADNDDIAQGNSLWDAALDEDAGKKYGEGTYGKDTLIRVRGNITDEGSGVATIYYYVFDKEIKFEGNSTTPVVSGEYWTIKDTNSLRDYVVAAGSTNTNIHGGSFAPLVTPVTKRVFYNVDENDVDVHGDVIHDPTNPTGAADKKGTKLDNSLSDGYWKFYKNVKHTYDYKISGFDNPKNYLVIVAEDNIGNRSLDYADVYDEQEQGLLRKYFCAINYDNVLPVLTVDESSGEVKYVNTKEENGTVVFMNGTDVTLSGTASDADSKLKEISLEVNGYEVTETENDYGVITKTENGNTWNWTATLKASAFHGASGTVVVNAKAVDNAGDGNSSTMPVGTVMIDSRVPTVTLNAPADADSNSEGIQVNKKISFNGSANDNTTLPSDCVTKIQYSEKTEGWTQENAVWTDYEDNSGSYSVSGSYSFNVTDFNTELSGIKDKTYYEVRAVAHDVAGNTGYSDPVEIYVSQDSDRPIINLTNLTLQDTTSYLKSTTRLEGTVSDDDGAVSSVKYSTDGTTWNNVTLTGSAWNIPGLDEGDNTIYFMVTDAKGTTFTTAVAGAEGATEATQPKVKDEAGSYVAVNDGSLALNFTVVTKQPDVQNVSYSVYNGDSWIDRPSLGTVGGIYTKFKISLEARSASSHIRGVKAVYNGTDYSFTCPISHDDKNYHTWTSEEITVTEGAELARIVVSDASDETSPMIKEVSVDVAIDNTEPAVTIKAPSSTAGTKETMTVEVSEIATVYYGVTRAYADGLNGAEVTAAPSEWTQITDEASGLTRYVYFDDALDEKDHTDRFAIYLTEKYLSITTKADIEKIANPYETITPVKFWAKAVDRCGNETVVSTEVNVDPQGNRPTVSIVYPVNVLKDGVYQAPVLGGTIRIDGNAADDVSVKYVWLQIEREENAFNGADVKFLKSKGYEIGDMTTNNLLDAADITALADNASVSDYAIRITPTGNSWNCLINGNQEFNKTGEANLKLRVYATDADPNCLSTIHRSAAVEQNITIDSNTPYINESELVLVKYEGNTEVARQQYKKGVSIHGIWYLQGTIRDDDSGLKTVEYKLAEDAGSTKAITAAGDTWTSETDSHFYFTKIAHTEDASKFDYNFSIPLGKTATGTVGEDTVLIHAVEDTTQSLYVDRSYEVIYDNKAPVFNTDSNNLFVKLSSDVRNTNGFYTFGAIASEDIVKIGETDVSQSGVERIAFYFTRDLDYSLSQLNATLYNKHTGEKDSKTNDLFDIMLYHAGSDAADESSGNMIVNYKGKAEGENAALKYEDGLYWRSHSGTASGKSFTYTDENVDVNIHAGGLVKIGGVIYKIESVSGKTITVSSNISGTTADFALCNVIDYSGEKNGTSISSTHGYGYGYYGSRPSDDGDLITESFNNQGTDWIFDASINSKNLPDGPITLHMVAFDKAGNVTATPYTMNGTVKNNAPRISGVIAGTDENGNGSVDSGELIDSFSNKYAKGYDASGNEVNDATFPVKVGDEQNSLLTIKGLTVVKPEIIGGNGALTYSYKVYPYNKTTNTWPDTTTITNAGGALKNAAGTVLSGTTDDVAMAQITLPVSDFIGTTNNSDTNYIPDGKKAKFTFIFGDSTPGASLNDASGKNTASMSIIMDVALREANAAKNWILPFYWKSKDDNSLFKQSKDYGHIELSRDWVTAPGYNAGNAEYDADPKVSGMIKIEGIAQDDTLLDAINVQFGKSMGGLGTTDTAIATYDAEGASWTVTALQNDGSIDATTGWASAVQQATYQELVDVGIIDALPENTDASAKVPYTSQNYGHVVHWILYIDTQKVTDTGADAVTVTANDVTVTATATDRGTPVWNSSANEGAGGAAYTENAAAITGKPADAGAPFSGAVTKTVTDSGTTINQGDLTGVYRMDIVPYISGIKTGLSSLKKANSSVYDRTALGHYAVSDTEDIYIYGFNLEGGTLYDSTETKTAALTETAVTSSMKWYSASLPFTKVYKTTYDSNSGTGGISAFTSGEAYVKVGDVQSLNNLNNNSSYGKAYAAAPSVGITGDKSVYDNFYNRQPNGDNNNLLTDDVVLDVWGINGEAVKPKNGYATQPVMAINPVNKQVGFAFANGSLRFSMGSLDKSYDFWEHGLDFWTSIGFAYDANGNSFGTAAGGDINATKADSFGLFTSRWSGKGYTASTNGHNNGTGQLRLELIGQSESTFTNDTVNINKERIKSPSIATTVASADATDTNVYLAYYDEINNEIRFKWGIISDSDNVVRKGRIYYAGQDSYYNSINDKTSCWETGLFADYYGPKDSDGSDNSTKDTTTKTVSLTGTKVIKDLPYTLEYASLIAGQTTNKKTFVPGASGTKYTANTAVMTRDNKPVHAGQYVSIAAKYQAGDTYVIRTEEIPVIDEETGEPVIDEETGNPVTDTVSVNFTDDLVVAVWYDATNNQMLYSYNTAPQKIKAPTYKGNNYNTIDSYSQSATGWSTPVAVFGEGNGIGEYCKVALDNNGKVHIACYDNGNADVWYAYIDNFANPEGAKTCIVDSYGIVGTELSLDVALVDSKPVPYISYYGSSCARPKVAYWAGAESIKVAAKICGADDEAFSQLWESSVVPSTSKISLDHMNVGVWKDGSGNLTYSTLDGAVPNGKSPGASGSNLGKSNAGNSDGKVYGNGSKNPILGYAITKGSGGFIETAQMK